MMLHPDPDPILTLTPGLDPVGLVCTLLREVVLHRPHQVNPVLVPVTWHGMA